MLLTKSRRFHKIHGKGPGIEQHPWPLILQMEHAATELQSRPPAPPKNDHPLGAAAGAIRKQGAAAGKLQLKIRPGISKAAAQPKAPALKGAKAAAPSAPGGGPVHKRPKAAPIKAAANGPTAGGDTGISSLLELAGTAPAAPQQLGAAADGSVALGQTPLGFMPKPDAPAAQATAVSEAAAAATKKQRTKASDLDVAAVGAKVAAKHASCSLKDLSIPEMQCYLRLVGDLLYIPSAFHSLGDLPESVLGSEGDDHLW